jgi:hypothetical protein
MSRFIADRFNSITKAISDTESTNSGPKYKKQSLYNRT